MPDSSVEASYRLTFDDMERLFRGEEIDAGGVTLSMSDLSRDWFGGEFQ